MKFALLKELCSIRSGGTPSKAESSFWQGDIPWVSPKDMKSAIVQDAEDHISCAAVEGSATSVVPAGSILVVVRSGILAHTFPVAMVGRPVAFNQDIKAITPTSPKIDGEYLFWFMRSSERAVLNRGVKKGATVHSLQAGFLERLEVPLPPLPEQRRIVDLLSRADGIVRLRRDARKKAAELIPAIFLDMFGDPATNPKGWPMVRVGEFVARFVGGKNLQAGSEEGSLYRILKVSAATSGVYNESESKPTPDGYVPPVNHVVREGDLLFSRANTKDLVGATALVERTNGATLLPDKLWRFVWSTATESKYVNALFQSAHVRRELGRVSSGTSASMRNISQAKLFQMRVPLAPIELQRRFGSQVDQVRAIDIQQEAAAQRSEQVFDALLARAFTA